MKMELTEGHLKTLKPPAEGRVEISDAKRAGLRLRVYATGRAVWMYEKRVKGGAKRKHTLGTYCIWNSAGRREAVQTGLAEARGVALEIEAEASRGHDRILAARISRSERDRIAATVQTLQSVIDAYAELHLSTLRKGDERKRQIMTALEKHLTNPIGDLTRASLQEPIDKKAKEGRLFMANRIRAAIKHFTRWAWRREYISDDIGDRLERATKERIRERVLSIGEVRSVWAKSFDLGEVWGPLVRLLLLTLQRRSSVTNLRKREVDLVNTRFKRAIADEKNERAQITHLSAPALNEVQIAISRMKADATEDYLFTTTGRTPVSGWSKAKARLDDLLGEGFEPWRIHDFRTAFATIMAERGTPESTVDRVLNHSASGSAPSAVARVYNQSEQLQQRAQALNTWADLVTGQDSVVIQIGGQHV